MRVPALDGLHSIKFCTFLSPFQMGLTNFYRAFGRFSLLSISLKLLTLSGIPSFSINWFRPTSLLALLVGLNPSFLTGALLWFIKITKVVPFESVEAFRKYPILALYFSLSSLMIFRPLYFLHQLLSLRWRSGLLPTAMEATQEAQFWLERWYLPLNPIECDAFFFLVDLHQANLQPNLLSLGSVSIPLQLFLGSPSTALFPFLSMYLRWRPSFSHVSRPYAVSLLPHGALSLLYEASLRPPLTYASPGFP